MKLPKKLGISVNTVKPIKSVALNNCCGKMRGDARQCSGWRSSCLENLNNIPPYKIPSFSKKISFLVTLFHLLCTIGIKMKK